ncbi:MAG: SusD/RagB family nutrient-binding outer membrane lipoprotein [Dysgonomonas sp.]|nr:SusD/RagB family nutrient-binding outer membrane lipoprotein [Dysgonomonas sp.]
MKQILLYTSIISILLFSSCESEMDKRFQNPDGFKDAKIEFLYSYGAARTIENDYGDFWTYVFRLTGVYTQTVAGRTGSGRTSTYIINDDKTRWENFYVKRMQELVEMDKIYNFVLDDVERAKYGPYMETAKVLKAYNTTMASDFFNDMPYTEAWGARNALYGQPQNLTPKYDKQKDIYYTVLSELESAANYVKNNSLDATIEQHKLFSIQDLVYKGDFGQWYKFANSLRLRYAMRISDVDEAKAKEVLGKLSLDDLIVENKDNAYIWLTGRNNIGIWRAIEESFKGSNDSPPSHFAPAGMVNIQTQANDPRLRVFFQPPSNADGVVYDQTKPIKGYPTSATDAEEVNNQYAATNPKEELLRKEYSSYNVVTFRYNYTALPNGVGITASDVYFLLAEARARNLITWGNAEEFYNKGIILSVQEYYKYYKNSPRANGKEQAIVDADISDATLLAWLNASSYKYDSSKALEQIATQRWMHMSILQPFESWTEYRRTDLPKMADDVEGGVLLNQQNMPVRFLYPTNESTMNAANFNAVADQNYSNKRVWWDVK